MHSELGNVVAFYLGVLGAGVLGDSEVLGHFGCTCQLIDEFVVVGDDNELEAAVLGFPTIVDDAPERLGKALDIPFVKVRRGFIESKHTTIVAEGLSQRQPHHQRR